ncbi:MAG: hypothetical protein SF123_17760 [Chloroflexota bacterium]|nr:hypothetical protein [Chloroflexota bacterium]
MESLFQTIFQAIVSAIIWIHEWLKLRLSIEVADQIHAVVMIATILVGAALVGLILTWPWLKERFRAYVGLRFLFVIVPGIYLYSVGQVNPLPSQGIIRALAVGLIVSAIGLLLYEDFTQNKIINKLVDFLVIIILLIFVAPYLAETLKLDEALLTALRSSLITGFVVHLLARLPAKPEDDGSVVNITVK